MPYFEECDVPEENLIDGTRDRGSQERTAQCVAR